MHTQVAECALMKSRLKRRGTAREIAAKKSSAGYLVYLDNQASEKRIVKTTDLLDQKTAP